MKFGRRFSRSARLLFAVVSSFLLLCITVIGQQPHTLTGDIRVHKSFHSGILNNDRDVLVYLPANYDSNEKKRYPVLYLHDGQNLFDGATSFIPGQEWRVDETAQRLIAAGKIESLIIVGVYKKPFIDSHYRTKRDAKSTGLGGSSLGGLVSLYLSLKYSNVFGRAAVVSPSVWFANKQIVRYVEALPKKPSVRIWLDIGTKEGQTSEEAQQSLRDARLLRDTLIKKGWRSGNVNHNAVVR